MRASIIVGLTIIATATFAVAQPPAGRGEAGGRPPEDGGRRPPGFDRSLVEELDTDGDGALSKDELSKAPPEVKRLDRNGDGELSIEELRVRGGEPGRGGGFGRGGGPGRGGRRGPGRERMKLVDRFDEDKDGRLNRQERDKAREFVKSNNADNGRGRGGPGGRGGFRGGPGGPGGFRGGDGA